MASLKFIQTNCNFSLGWSAPEFAMRGDMKTASASVSRLENMDVLPSGGLARRAGTRQIYNTPIAEDAVLVPFHLGVGEEYLLILGGGRLRMFLNGAVQQTITTPWADTDLKNIQWAQRDRAMIFTHPNFPPQILSRKSSWNLLSIDFSYPIVNDMTHIPFYKFDGANNPFSVAVTSSGGTRTAQLTAIKANWTEGHVGAKMRFGGMEWWITSFVSATCVNVATNNATIPAPTTQVTNWSESVWSNAYGYPRAVSIFQNRLVFAGTRTLPNFVWMSKTGEVYDFEAGTGLDNDAIVASLPAPALHTISSVISAENLEILTDMGEWSIKGSPVTPSSFTTRKHTNIGSKLDRFLPPQRVDGATIFMSKTGCELRELKLDNLSDTYSAVDLASLSQHLMNDPISMTYSPTEKRLLIVMADGTISALTKDDNLEVLGWSQYKTDGEFRYVVMSNDRIYAVVNRNGAAKLEMFDQSVWTDGLANFAFVHRVESWPIFSDGTPARSLRITKMQMRFIDTTAFTIRVGHSEPEMISLTDAEVEINSLGTIKNSESVWELSGTTPLTLISLTLSGRLTI
ncbi:MAG: hypothetical protein LBB23_02365 [Rickettsiales bacterium]|nr:hypothetical protein [Rickettsiales bacterium]